MENPSKKLKFEALEKALQPIGINKEYLNREISNGYTVSDALINSERSPLLNIKTDIQGIQAQISGKIRAEWKGEEMKTHFIGVQQSLSIPQKLGNFEFTNEDKQNLQEKGHLGRVANINEKETYISVDKETNTLITTAAKNINIPTQILGKALTDEQQKKLKEGKSIILLGLEKDGNKFNSTIQVDANKKGLSFKESTLPHSEKILSQKSDNKPKLIETRIENNATESNKSKIKI